MIRTAIRLSCAALLSLAALAPASSHDMDPYWLAVDALDDGVYVGVKHPGVIRDLGPFSIEVTINNVDGGGPVRVREIRYYDEQDREAWFEAVDRNLDSNRDATEQYREVRRRLQEMAGAAAAAATEETRAEAASLLEARADLIAAIASNTFVTRYPVDLLRHAPDGQALRMSVEVDLEQGGAVRTIRRAVDIAIRSPLPGAGAARAAADTGGPAAAAAVAETWYAGDQHLHTRYSIDAYVTEGTTSNVADYAAAAQLAGLDWIVVTDHSNIHTSLLGETWYTPQQFEAGASQAAQYRLQNGFLVLNGQEMGLGAYGTFGAPAHLLALPAAVESMGYLPNPCSGLVFNHVNCEPEQVVIDRVNAAGGLGFVAHPFESSGLFYEQWNFDNGADGWAGFEIFNDPAGNFGPSDRQALLKWLQLLNAIQPPTGGQLHDRPGYPTRFPVGVGNSDAHQLGAIGKTFTYCRAPSASQADIMGALADGRCVASNGPLVIGEINGATAGEVALLQAAGNTIEITLETTPEFGPVGDYKLLLISSTGQINAVQLSGAGYTTTLLAENVKIPASLPYLVLAVVSGSGKLAIANPIWLQQPAN